jgi:uncharacterized damage-inducible protein DinB
MKKQTLINLFNYHYWANRRLWLSVSALSDQQFSQLQSDGGPSIKTQVVHMVANENLWVNYLWHNEVEFLQESDFQTRSCIQHEWEALEEEILDFIDELTAATLEQLIEPDFLDEDQPMKVWQILLQIINQASDNRSQIRLCLDRLGSPLPTEDFSDFLVDQRQPIPA